MSGRLSNFQSNISGNIGTGVVALQSVQATEVHGRHYMSFLKHFNPNVKDTTVNEIYQMRYPDGDLVVKPDDMSVMAEIIKIFHTVGDEDKALEILRSKLKHEEKIPWSLDYVTSYKQTVDAEYDMIRSKSTGIKTGTPCKVCGADNFVYVNTQTRSADEPETVWTVCLECSDRTLKQ